MSSQQSVYEVYVAHYGHPLLKGSKHWAVVVMTNPAISEGRTYEVQGSRASLYTVKKPETVQLHKAQSFLGCVCVGRIDSNSLGIIHDILVATPILQGKAGWNCQSWVIDALYRLRIAGYEIMAASHEEILRELALTC